MVAGSLQPQNPLGLCLGKPSHKPSTKFMFCDSAAHGDPMLSSARKYYTSSRGRSLRLLKISWFKELYGNPAVCSAQLPLVFQVSAMLASPPSCSFIPALVCNTPIKEQNMIISCCSDHEGHHSRCRTLKLADISCYKNIQQKPAVFDYY